MKKAVIALLAGVFVPLIAVIIVSSTSDEEPVNYYTDKDRILSETKDGIVYAAFDNVYAIENVLPSISIHGDYFTDYSSLDNSEEYIVEKSYTVEYDYRSGSDYAEAMKYRDYLLEKGFVLFSDFRFVEYIINDVTNDQQYTPKELHYTPICLLLAPDNQTGVTIGDFDKALFVEICKYKENYVPIPAKGINLSDVKDSYSKGEIIPLQANLSPSDNSWYSYDKLSMVEFESSDTSVIMVSQSEYYSGQTFCSAACVGVGTAVITASAPNGISESFTVTVTDSDAVIDAGSELPSWKDYISKDEEPLTPQELYETCSPAVFTIEGYNFATGEPLYRSGFFISENGLALTTKSAIVGMTDFTVFTSDGKTYPAIVLHSSDFLDYALIKVLGSDFPHLKMCLQLRKDDNVYAFGTSPSQPHCYFEGKITDLLSMDENSINFISFSANPLNVDGSKPSEDISDISIGGALINEYGCSVGIVKYDYSSKNPKTIAVRLKYLKENMPRAF